MEPGIVDRLITRLDQYIKEIQPRDRIKNQNADVLFPRETIENTDWFSVLSGMQFDELAYLTDVNIDSRTVSKLPDDVA